MTRLPRRLPLHLTLAALLLALSPDARAQSPGEEAPAPVESSLRELWFVRTDALRRGDTVEAASAVDSMRSLVRAERLDRVPWLSRAFSFEGYQRLREGNYERAREAFDIARRFDSRSPEAQTGYAWAALRAGRGFGAFVREYRRALRLRWEAFLRDGKANALITVIVAMGLLSAGVILILVIRYNAMLRHDVAELLPPSWSDGPGRVAGWVVLLAPLLIWIGGVWLLLYWCVILARYMSPSERVLAGLACVAVVATGPLAAQSARGARHAADPTLLAMQEAVDGGYGKDVIRFLQSTLERSPDSVMVRLLLANTYQRANLNREAFEEYQRVLERAPRDPRALNNIGTLYMKTGQAGQAVVYFGRAQEAQSDRAEIYHNLHLAQSAALRLSDAEASLRRLQQLDPALARSLMDARASGEEPAPIPLWLSSREVTAYVERMQEQNEPISISGHLGAPTSIGAMAALVFLGWSALLSRSPSRAQVCIRCGDAFCGKCKREIGAKECCAQCIHLFVKRDPIAPEAREQKLRQVERFGRLARLRVRLASILLPGAGHLLAGRTIAGFVLAGLWTLPLSVILLQGRLILQASFPGVGPASLTVLLASSLMALTWLAANILSPRSQT